MKHSEGFVAVVVILIAGVSVFFLGVGEPEDQMIVSDDGRVTVQGQWQSGIDVSIETIADGRYLIAPTYLYSNGPLWIHFLVDDPSSVDVFRMNDTLTMWEPTSATMSAGEWILETERLGRFALVDRPFIDPPTFEAQFDKLMTMAPDTAVGYELAVGVLDDVGGVWRLADQTRHGGCEGVVGRGNAYERSQLEHEARVLVDDVETPIHFLFVGLWTVDESGCEEGLSF